MRQQLWVKAGLALVIMGSLAACSGGGGSSSDGTDGVTDATDATDATDGFADTTDGTADGADATDGTADGADASDGTGCTPFCQPGWECGPDNCGGECGTGCTGAETCNTALRKCEASVEPPKGFGEPCGITDTCKPDTASWPACLNAQCASGSCLNATVCTQECNIAKDQVDHTGTKVSDGIEDGDAAGSECANPADGAYGTTWRCVQLRDPAQGNPLLQCLPGTTFKPCESDSECPSGESCQVQVVNGQPGTRCTTHHKAGVDIGNTCNGNPEDGEVQYCKSDLCFGIGCVAICGGATDCLTDTCQGGTCVKGGGSCAGDVDCSAFECEVGVEIYGSQYPEYTFDVCLGKGCESNLDCPGDFACNLFGNGESGAAFALDNSCGAVAAGASKLGGECDTDPDDAVDGPECAGLCLNSGVCSSLCKTDDHCAGGANMICNANTETLDTEPEEADGIDDAVAIYGLCVPVEGSKTNCFTNSDCTGGEVCEFYNLFTADGVDGVGYCVKPAAEGAGEGEACGGATAVQCKSGFCLNAFQDAQGNTSGYCTNLCSSTSDCPQGILKSEQVAEGYNSVCRALLYSAGPSIDDASDNIYVPLCDLVNGTDSLEDCSGDYACGEATEACLQFVQAFGAAGPVTKEFHCAESTGTAKFNASCNLTGEDPPANELCEDIYCAPDAKEDSGYCTKLCDTDEDCAGGSDDMVCDGRVIFERKSGDNVELKICAKAKSCIPCGQDTDCTEGFVCGNMGGAGLNADMRCMPACSVDGDCAATDGGDKCVQTKDAAGAATTSNACVPASCN